MSYINVKDKFRREKKNKTKEPKCQKSSNLQVIPWISTFHLDANLPIFLLTAITCGHPGNPAHGMTNGSEFNLNDVVNFTCNTGYLLQGASRAQCRSNGQWSSPLPNCRGKKFLPSLKILGYNSRACPPGIYSHLYLGFCVSTLEIVFRAEYWGSLGFSVFYLKFLRLQSPAFSL